MFWALLGRSGALLGTLGTLLGVSWSSFGRSWGTLGALLDALGALLGHSWALLGAFWRRLAKKGRWYPFWGAQLGTQMEPSWSQILKKSGSKNDASSQTVFCSVLASLPSFGEPQIEAF